MSKIINFPVSEIADTIEVIRTDEFYRLAKNISDMIKGFPLSSADNDKLISLMVKQINEVEHSAYLQGFDMGFKVMKDFA